MGDPTPRAARSQFDSRVRIVVEDGKDLRERYAANLSSGGMFIRDTSPLAVGARVLIELLLPDDRVICRLVAEVIHSRPSMTHDDATAGMGVRFVQMDEAAKKLAVHFQNENPSTDGKTNLPPLSVDPEGPV
ncbi:MAG: PilZ domain-containing protein, partial [Myxococcota bacterium]